METLVVKAIKVHMQQHSKKNLFVEANAMNISGKFQLYIACELIFDIFCKFSLLVAMTSKQIESICLAEDHSTNLSKKLLSKSMQ